MGPLSIITSTIFEDLAGKKVVVVNGSLGDLYLTKNIPSAQLTKFEMNTEALQALKDGRADAYLQDNVVLYYWARQNPEFQVLPEKIEPTPWAPAVKEGNKELKDWVNSELSKLGKEQYLHKLYEEYLRNELGPELDPDDFVIESSK
ncbi:transporter substrate-binding domain-containing protein [Bacillus sp. FJAT-49825]|uniref:Transporter substrate-binding domain-containing protein n=1 Tax=Neobacillus rhizophilus TaxID=2833579 RepID=A0A942U9Z7_9BACI|nr:transporter substrate-binding domain-containing protein [Neobacillus rhizophilus]MBS4214249.1 transporter substrate-binding domain-containing protein [Neobacillus rhizophilus]